MTDYLTWRVESAESADVLSDLYMLFLENTRSRNYRLAQLWLHAFGAEIDIGTYSCQNVQVHRVNTGTICASTPLCDQCDGDSTEKIRKHVSI